MSVLSGHVVSGIAQSSLTEERLNQLADSLVGYSAEGALNYRLVDGLLFRDTLNDTLKILSGMTTDDKDHGTNVKVYQGAQQNKMVSARTRYP